MTKHTLKMFVMFCRKLVLAAEESEDEQ